ncbi:MAG: hypothetical protein GYB67_19105 [Chloroflexi bacterium]|nr:hypothetical protein [Chloroflexota bacterium]
MTNMELYIATSTVRGLKPLLDTYDGVYVIQSDLATPEILTKQLQTQPHALFLDDSSVPITALWEVINKALLSGIRTFIGLYTPASQPYAEQLRGGGAKVITRPDAESVAAWIAQELGLQHKAVSREQRMLSIGVAKGGVGKTLLTTLLAEGFQRRGLQTLYLDGDPSNPGGPTTYRVSASSLSYLHLAKKGAIPVNVLQQHIIHHPSGIHLLLGADPGGDDTDLDLAAWRGLLGTVRQLPDERIVLVDTGPDYKRRPYAATVLREDGYVILPVQPGQAQTTAAINMLSHLANKVPGAERRCFIVYVEPEKGSVSKVSSARAMLESNFPGVRELGVLPRDARAVSMAGEHHHDRYVSPLDVGGKNKLVPAITTLVNDLCTAMDIMPPLSAPRSGLLQRMFGGQRAQAPETSSGGAR